MNAHELNAGSRTVPPVTFEVAQRFYGLHRQFLAARLIAGLALGVAALMAAWVLLAVSDYRFEWSVATRRQLLAVTVVSVVAVALFQMIWVARDSRKQRFIGMLEHHFSSLGQRLRTVLQSAEGRLTAPAEMLTALGHQTLGRWETAAPTQIVPRRATWSCCLAGVIMTMAATAGLGPKSDWRIALLRSAGQDLPYTTMQVLPGDIKLLEGTPVTASLELRGRTQRQVVVRYREAETEMWVESELFPSLPAPPHSDQDPEQRSQTAVATFEANFGQLKKPLEYQFVTSVGTTRLYRLDVQPMIEAKRFETRVTPPAYTQLSPRVFPNAEVSVLAGSQVTVTVETNHPLAEASLAVGEKPRLLEPAEVSPGDTPTQWVFELPAVASLHWRFSGAGHDGTPMKPIAGRLRIHHDDPPKIQWVEPADELSVHMLSEVPMQVNVSDDYGLLEAGIVFQIGDEDELVLSHWTPEADTADDDRDHPQTATASAVATRVRLQEVLPLESFGLSERDYVAYYAYAIDNRTSAGDDTQQTRVGQRTETDVRYIDIRPLRQFFSEQDMEPGMPGGGSRVGLDELIRRERFLMNRTREWVREPHWAVTSQLAMVERMVTAQSELADLTRFLAERLLAQGNDDVESLNQAEAAMLQAVDALSSTNFSLAMVHQETALRSLVEARRLLEIVFQKNNSPQLTQQRRQLRRQLMQKLRRSQPETDTQLADSLRRLATEQNRLARDADARGAAMQASSAAMSDAEDETKSEDGAESKDIAEAGGVAESGDVVEDVQLWIRQQDLLERLREIDEGLSPWVKASTVVQQRIDNAVREMDSLIGSLRDQEYAKAVSPANELADQLNELALHVEAISPTEPAKRISSLRDLTISLANMERQLSLQSHTGPSLHGTSEDQKQAATGDPVSDADDDPSTRLARRAGDRAETISDVLDVLPTTSDLQEAEVMDLLTRFADESGLRDELAETRDAAAKDLQQQRTRDWAQAAMRRAGDYADKATQLDQLYRQWETPRLDQLRQLENQAARITQSSGQNFDGGSTSKTDGTPQAMGGTAQEPLESESEGRGGKSLAKEIRELERGLRAADLEELADALSNPPPDGAGDDIAFAQADMKTQTADRFSPTNTVTLTSQVLWVQRELRHRIQEMILLEISVDRNLPVPAAYRELVDGYFRTLAAEPDPYLPATGTP